MKLGTTRPSRGGPVWTGVINRASDAQVRKPLDTRRPTTWFCNSMSDLFHDAAPDAWRDEAFAIMRAAHWHRFQVLTKRAERLEELGTRLSWPSNVWMGVSVENEDYVSRIDHLREVPAAVRFLSLEPLLGPIPRLPLEGIDWVIVGGESGPGARAAKPEWIRGIRDQCLALGVPFFFKQWGGVQKKRQGRTLDGRTWNDMPSFVPPKGKLESRLATAARKATVAIADSRRNSFV